MATSLGPQHQHQHQQLEKTAENVDDLGLEPGEEANFRAAQRSFSFWAIIVGLGVTLLLAALENTVLTTAAPVILAEIPLDDDWVWLTNAFFLASAAFQPLLGQLANLCGRRWTTMAVIALFMLGSAVCGGARDPATLIAGRTVQGLGSGGIVQAFGTYCILALFLTRIVGPYICVATTNWSPSSMAMAMLEGS
jgi:MFS family permease